MKATDRNNHDSDVERWVEEHLAGRLPSAGWIPDATRAFARFQMGRQAKRSRGGTFGYVAISVLVTSVSLAAFPAARTFARRCVTACLTETSKLRQVLVGGASTFAGSNVFVKVSERTMAPDFTLSDASGRPVRLSEYRGKVVVLNFWATWCVPCNIEMPYLVGFQRAYGDRNFEVLGVSLDEDGWKSVKPYLDDKQVNYPVMIGKEEVTRAYGGLEVVPTTLVIDRVGRIAATHRGLCRRDEYEADIQAVLNE